MTKKMEEGIYRQSIIRPLATRENLTSSEVREAAARLNFSERHVRRLIADYVRAPVSTTLEPGHRVSGPRRRRLPLRSVEIMCEQIQKRWLGRKEKLPVRELHILIEAACLSENTSVPSISTIRRELKKISCYRKALAKKIKGEPHGQKLYPHHYDDAKYPGHIIQLDHTQVDAILDLTAYDLGRYRIWLTLAIDLATRLVFGYYLGITAPSARSSGLALMQGMLPKEPWIAQAGIDVAQYCSSDGLHPWPSCGAIQLVHTDNGRDFLSVGFELGCMILGAKVQYFRPPGKTHYGAHVERLLGTFNQAVHTLPGTTFSNVVEKGKYTPEKRTFLTLEDFEDWFLTLVLEYHLRPHAGLDGVSPALRYQQLKSIIPMAGRLDIDAMDIRAAFLPVIRRKVRGHGIRFHNRFYYHPNLDSLVGKTLTLRYHPARIDKLWVCLDGRRPDFEVAMIGETGKCIHMDALVDRKKTVELERQIKTSKELSKRLFLKRHSIVENARKRRFKRKRTDAPARLVIYSFTGAPRVAPQGNAKKW